MAPGVIKAKNNSFSCRKESSRSVLSSFEELASSPIYYWILKIGGKNDDGIGMGIG